MLTYLAKRIVYTLPIMLGVAFVCFLLVHMAPGDPLVSVLPPDASEQLKTQMLSLIHISQRRMSTRGGVRQRSHLQSDR